MLIHRQLEFHNVSELVASGPGPGLRLQRLPTEVRRALEPLARSVACSPTHAELRYVSPAPEVRLTLHSEAHHEYVRIYQGDFFREEICLNPGEIRTLCLSLDRRLLDHGAALRPDPTRGFATNVVRLRLSGTGRVRFVDVDANDEPIRPPVAEEKPALTLIAYGSSITQGFSASRLAGSYLMHAAQRLGVDAINLGFGGSCRAEPAIAAHLSARSDWHLAWLELGVNLLNGQTAVDDETFRRRAHHLIDTVSRNPARTVFVTTLFTGAHDLPGAPRAAEPWRRILRETVAMLARPNLHLADGRALLDWSGLTGDLVHPADAGHAQIGTGLAELLAPHVRPRS